MKIALAQINPAVGDLRGNKEKILSFLEQARKEKVGLVVFPELTLTGWPPKDLLLRKEFVYAAEKALEDIVHGTYGIGVLLGTITTDPDSGKLYNSAILMEDGSIIGRLDKPKLSNRCFFEETNYFIPAGDDEPGQGNCLCFKGIHIEVIMGDDFQAAEAEVNVCDKPDILIDFPVVPYYYQGLEKRTRRLSNIASKRQTFLISINQVGGNDELVFDGSSMVFDTAGNLICMAKPFEEQLFYFNFNTDISYSALTWPKEDISWIYNALVLGMRDYFQKGGFKKTVLGLSGGIDSALAVCLAVEALGRQNVLGVSMPSRYSPDDSRDDASQLANKLGIEYRILPIEELFAAYIKLMNKKSEAIGDLAEENIQARIRGNLLMFISNREGRILINTSNKSESAMGYSTLYGDMCGGLSPIADIPKTMVYQLCEYINRNGEIIPVNTMTKPPSAELRPNQTDQDSLPDYSILDAVIQMYMEDGFSAAEIFQHGYDKELVLRIISRIEGTEYKRRQAPPMLKITSSKLLRGGTLPMIQRFQRG